MQSCSRYLGSNLTQISCDLGFQPIRRLHSAKSLRSGEILWDFIKKYFPFKEQSCRTALLKTEYVVKIKKALRLKYVCSESPNTFILNPNIKKLIPFKPANLSWKPKKVLPLKCKISSESRSIYQETPITATLPLKKSAQLWHISNLKNPLKALSSELWILIGLKSDKTLLSRHGIFRNKILPTHEKITVPVNSRNWRCKLEGCIVNLQTTIDLRNASALWNFYCSPINVLLLFISEYVYNWRWPQKVHIDIFEFSLNYTK